MPSSTVEFVNREAAESEAARAIGLLNQSYEAKVEAWFALQAVADQVGPASNTGIRGIHWQPAARTRGGGFEYRLRASCIDGRVDTSIKATADAKQPEALEKAQKALLRAINKAGGLTYKDTVRPNGTGAALVEAVSSTEEGRRWLASYKHPHEKLLMMVRVCDAYGRDGINISASLEAHKAFITFVDRRELILKYPGTFDAYAARARRLRDPGATDSAPKKVSATTVRKIARSSGAPPKVTRAVLEALRDGTSEIKLRRLIKQAVVAIDEMADAAEDLVAA